MGGAPDEGGVQALSSQDLGPLETTVLTQPIPVPSTSGSPSTTTR